ncbi:MAG: T9SS type A sorting domain-containing protein [Saprospiraceae bacterium]|nr:T9SS type A sorting domain-containing protein [Saprospiraceae bacterium]
MCTTSTTFFIGDVSNGVYFININTDDSITTRKIVVQE